MLSARINYRVKNISSDPIQSLDVKCVWYSLNGEQLDQSTEYVIGYGDVPFGAGQFKTGFIRCGKGYGCAAGVRNGKTLKRTVKMSRQAGWIRFQIDRMSRPIRSF
jgi:hypothetical protein